MKKLKINIPFYNKIILSLCFLFFVGTTFSQGIKTNITLFGKPVNAKNINPNNGIIRCATVEYEKYLQEKNPKRQTDAQFEDWIAPLVKNYQTMRTSSQVGTIITIPVVVHVIYNGQAVGVAPNITDAQVQSQITVLTQDFRKMVNTNGANNNAVGADTQIQFELAKQDPNGNPTNGIDRVNLNQDSWSVTEMDVIVKPKTFWDPTQYMNMWCVKLSDDTLLGYAQFPDASTLTGIDSSNGNANTDGVVSSYDVFGSSEFNNGTFLLNKTYNLGRTMTHEVGHFLGLRHIWGDSECGTDYCNDTPAHHDANYRCPIVTNCDSTGDEMVQNYMDYTDDSCMNIFTVNQASRITTVMTKAIRRKELKTSTKNATIPLFANDAEVKLEANNEIPSCSASTSSTIQKIVIINRGTTNLTTATLRYTINRGVNYTNYTWTGNLAINQSITFPITLYSTANGTLSISVLTANGVTDERLSNNTATGAFIIPKKSANYASTTYDFKLQQDFWGSETTWSLTNSSGVALYSGGPYTDTYKNATTISEVPTLITRKWTLANNQCYTFTIKDGAADGICCGGTGLDGSGDGYYELKTADGTIVKSGANFNSAIESVAFSTNTLGNSEFETSNDIFIYPNPAKESLKIEIPSAFGLPENYTIYNSLGTKISIKKVSSQNDLTVNTSAMPAGIYFITIEKEGAKKTLQFIKE
jgi:hypothetical protein